MRNPLSAIVRFYLDGFRTMTVGKYLWLLIALKLLVMFAILKPFFFPNHLSTHCSTPAEKTAHVATQLTARLPSEEQQPPPPPP